MRIPRTNHGLTIIELLVVIVVICVLGTLIAISYNGVQAKNRNAERRTTVDTLKRQLEAYYAQTNTYPTFVSLNDPAWRAQNLKHLPANALEDPNWNKTIACTTNNKPVASAQPAANCYGYQVAASEGSPCDNINAPCAHYTITASLEGGETYVKSSLN